MNDAMQIDDDEPWDAPKSVYETYGKKVWEKSKLPGKLYPHQVECIQKIQAHLEMRSKNHQSRVAAVELATGTGKSGIAIVLPYCMEAKRVLVITPRTQLRTQLLGNASFEGSKSEYPFLMERKIVPRGNDARATAPLGRVKVADSFERLVVNQHEADMLIVNAAMFSGEVKIGRWQEKIDPQTYDYVIVDEAHFHPNTTWNAIRAHFSGSSIVFMTATPTRTDREEFCDADDWCYRFKRSQAVELGIIRDFTHQLVGQQAADEIQAHQEILHAIKEALDERDRNFPLPNGVKHKALFMVGRIGPVNASSIAYQLEVLAANDSILQALRCVAYVSGYLFVKREGEPDPFPRPRGATTDKTGQVFKSVKDLESSLDKFKNNSPDAPRILIINDMLREGFDLWSISVVAVHRSLGDGPIFAQFLGRACRRAKPNDTVGLQALFIHHRSAPMEREFGRYMDI